MEAGEMGPPKDLFHHEEVDPDDETESEEQREPALPWVDLQTADVAYDDTRYLEFRLTRLVNPIALAPAARIRRDSAEVGRTGGKLASLVDNRVTIVIPPTALKVACIYSIQVSEHRLLTPVYNATGLIGYILSCRYKLSTNTMPTCSVIKI